MRFRFVAAEKAHYGMALVCRCLAMSPAAFYAWHRRRPSDRDDADRRLAVDIAAAHTESHRMYGSHPERHPLCSQVAVVVELRVERHIELRKLRMPLE